VKTEKTARKCEFSSKVSPKEWEDFPKREKALSSSSPHTLFLATKGVFISFQILRPTQYIIDFFEKDLKAFYVSEKYFSIKFKQEYQRNRSRLRFEKSSPPGLIASQYKRNEKKNQSFFSLSKFLVVQKRKISSFFIFSLFKSVLKNIQEVIYMYVFLAHSSFFYLRNFFRMFKIIIFVFCSLTFIQKTSS